MNSFKSWLENNNESVIKQIVYHSSSANFRKFNFKTALQEIIWFTSDIDSLKREEKGAQGNKIIYSLQVDIKNPAGWDEYEKYMLDQLKSMGYDGAILPNENGFDGFVFNPNQIKIVGKEIISDNLP
jgi:hypothetical protein